MLRDINISNKLRDLKAAYMDSPHFRDIYLNFMQGKVPQNKGTARRMENSVRDYVTLDGLLFKIVPCGKDDYETVLCIPTSKAHILMDIILVLLGDMLEALSVIRLYVEGFIVPILPNN